ncbi:MAG: MFS transporter, partial [Microbacteriaceae bacterium]
MEIAFKNQTLLIGAQVMCGVGIASGVAVGGLLAEEIAGSTAAAGFAQTAVVLGAGILSVPLAQLAAKRGRRWSLTVGFSVGAAGAVLIMLAVASVQFWLLLLGMMLFGSGTATNLQSRYAATELVDVKNQARAMSIVLWATTVGSVAGPNLTDPGSRLGTALGIEPLSGPYIFSIIAFALAALFTLTLRMGAPSAGREGKPRTTGSMAALGQASHQANALFAVIAIVTAQTMMVAVMVMTPVSMVHDGMTLEFVGVIISVHIMGMYAVSPLFGWLADKLGARSVVFIGVAIFVAAFILGAIDSIAAHSEMIRLTISLFLVGLGWSACVIGGSTLLNQSVTSDIRIPLQGAVDSLMNVGAAALAALAGPVLAFGGFLAINVMAACLLVPVGYFGLRALGR